MRALLLAALVACGDSSITVDLAAPGQPQYFKGSIDGRSWQSITGVFDGAHTNYSLQIDGDFELTLVCEHDDNTFVAGQIYGTMDDAIVTLGSWNVPDCTEPTAPVYVPVMGLLPQQGILVIGSSTLFVTDLVNPFTIDVTPGVQDIAFTTTNYVVSIVHDQQITGTTDLADVNFGSGSPMLTNDYSASLVPAENATARTTVITRHGTFLDFTFDPRSAVFVPPDQLAFGDTQTFYFDAEDPDTQTVRSGIATGFAQTPDQFDLLAQIAAYKWNQTTRAVTWLPTTDYFTSIAINFTSDKGSETATASKQWLAAHGPTQIGFDEAGPPGYRWMTTDPTTRLTVESWSPELILVSSTTNTVP